MFVFLLSLLCAVQSQKIPHFVFSHIELVFFFLSYCTFYNIPFWFLDGTAVRLTHTHTHTTSLYHCIFKNATKVDLSTALDVFTIEELRVCVSIDIDRRYLVDAQNKAKEFFFFYVCERLIDFQCLKKYFLNRSQKRKKISQQ